MDDRGSDHRRMRDRDGVVGFSVTFEHRTQQTATMQGPPRPSRRLCAIAILEGWKGCKLADVEALPWACLVIGAVLRHIAKRRRLESATPSGPHTSASPLIVAAREINAAHPK